MPIKKQVIEEEEEEIINETPRRTRYGRTVKKPVRYEPLEKVEDDFSESDYDEGVDLSDCESIAAEDSEEDSSSDEDDSDADENGNLKEFVTYSDSEEDEELTQNSEDESECTDSDTESDYSDSE